MEDHRPGGRLNTRPQVVITHRVHEPVKQMLAHACDVVANDDLESWLASRFHELARGSDALMVFMPDKIDEPLLAQCPRLKVIAGAFKGYDNIDVEACTRRGVWVTIVPDLLSQPTAELALALILGLIRNLAPGDRLIRNARFQGWRPVLYGDTLTGKTLGIVGMGKLGQAFARLVAGFSARIIYYDPRKMSPVEEAFLAIGRARFDQILSDSDIVVITAPLAASTLHLIDADALTKMKKGAYLVNVGRGSVVDEAAVASALEQGQLAGYAADVFEMEDWARPDHPTGVHPRLLAQLNRTLLTPHLGTAVVKARLDIEMSAAASILQALGGERPADAINDIRKDSLRPGSRVEP
ncbi:MAG TPA: phosphonate dehydrogenase [Terriglobales bacterium]